MTKFLKRTVSIFLSFSVLVFRGPTSFGRGPNEQSGSSNSRQIEMEGNTEQSGSSDGQGESEKEHEVELPLLSKGEMANPAKQAYQFKKIQSADLSRSTDNTDHSRVVVSTADFFLYPPKSVKELFEVKDKEAAFHYRDAMLRTNIAELGNDKGKVARVGILFGRSLVTAITFLAAVITLSCSVGFIEIAQNYRNQDSSELNSKELKWSNWLQNGGKIGCALSAFLALVAAYNLYALCSKTCCDCYVCKTSDAGCSCCYGCDGCDDGRGYVGCINCCGEKLKCCPCDNGGFALDWCGRYGIGGNCCGGTAYEEHKVNSVKSVKYFEPFVREIADSVSEEIKLNQKQKGLYFSRFLIHPSLNFEKVGGKFEFTIPDNNQGSLSKSKSLCHMLPEVAERLIAGWKGLDFFREIDGTKKLADEWKKFEEFCSSKKGFAKFFTNFNSLEAEVKRKMLIDSVYKLSEDESILSVLPEFDIKSVKDEEIKKFIFVILAFCRCAIGEISRLDDFSKVCLCNCFNFFQAVVEVCCEKGDNHEN